MSDLFASHASLYAAARPRYPDALFDALAAVVPHRRLAWDAATGNGQAAVALARYFEQVYASDSSAEQLAEAEPHFRVTYQQAPAERADLGSGTAALVTVAQAAHWFHIGPFYAEVRRVLSPRGVIALWCYSRVQVSPEVDRVVEHFYSEVVGHYWAPGRRLVETGYATLPFPFDELLLPEFAIERVLTLQGMVDYITSWSATQLALRAGQTHVLADLRADLEHAWGDPPAARLARWPLHLRVGRMT